MARNVRLTGTQTPIWLIIFIITTVAGLAGCFILYAAYANKKDALESVEADIYATIQAKLESSDDTREEVISKIDNDPEASTRYGAEFFELVARVTDFGVRYIQLAKLVGWPADTIAPYVDEEGNQQDGDVKTFLAQPENKPAESLRQLLRIRDTMIAQLKSKADEATKKLAAAEDALNKERELRQQQAKQKDDEIAKLKAAIAQKDAEIKKIQDEMNAKVAKEHQEALNAIEQLTKGREELKKQREQLHQLIDGAISNLRGELEAMGRRPKVEVPVDADPVQKFQAITQLIREATKPETVATVGKERTFKVLRVDYKTGYVYIDAGTGDNVKKGDVFTVAELGIAGRKVAKALVEVVEVQDTFSAAGILDADPRNPIIRGDILVRGTGQPEEKKAAAAPAPAEQPAAKEEEKKEGGEGAE